MAGLLDGALSWLLTDPTQAGGGLLAKFLNPAAATNTPTPPPPVPSQLGSPFAFRSGLLGDSPLAQGIRGGLAGLAGSTGYRGAAAVGAGAMAGIDAARQRQAFNINNMFAGQQYQKGQLDLGAGYGNLAIMAMRLSKILGRPVTATDLMQHPELQAQAYGQPPQQQSGAIGGQTGLRGPLGQGDTPGATSPNGMPGDPNPTQPGAPGSGTAQSSITGDGSQQDLFGFGQAIQDAYLWNPEKIPELEMQAAQAGPLYQQMLAQIKAQNENTTVRPGGQIYRNGQLVAESPTVEKRFNPATGNYELVHVYPSGAVAPLGQDASAGSTGSAGATGGGLPDSLWTAQQYVESHFDPKAVSPAGATGPAQFTAATAQQYGGNGTDAQKAYMGDLYKKYGNLPTALAAYNWGPGNVDAWLKAGADPQKLPKETQKYISSVLDLTGGSPSGGSPSAGGGVVTEPGPGNVTGMQTREQEAEKAASGVDTAAAGAVSQKFAISQMLDASKSWTPGFFAKWEGDYRSLVQGLRSVFGLPDDPALNQKLADFQEFQKDNVNLVASLTKSVSPRASTQEMNFLGKGVINADMSRGGMQAVANQLNAVSDFQIAKQRGQQNWRDAHGGSILGFENDWNKHVSPTAVWYGNLDQATQAQIAANANKTPEGRALMKQIKSEITYIQQNGLMQ